MKKVPSYGVTTQINDLYFLQFTTDKKCLDIEWLASEITEKFDLHDYMIYQTKNGWQIRWYYDQCPYDKYFKKMRDIITEYINIIDRDWIRFFLHFSANVRLAGKWKGDIKLYKEVKVNKPIDKKIKEAGNTLRFVCELCMQEFKFEETFEE